MGNLMKLRTKIGIGIGLASLLAGCSMNNGSSAPVLTVPPTTQPSHYDGIYYIANAAGVNYTGQYEQDVVIAKTFVNLNNTLEIETARKQPTAQTVAQMRMYGAASMVGDSVSYFKPLSAKGISVKVMGSTTDTNGTNRVPVTVTTSHTDTYNGQPVVTVHLCGHDDIAVHEPSGQTPSILDPVGNYKQKVMLANINNKGMVIGMSAGTAVEKCPS